MIALWMAYATLIGSLLVVATLVVERTASGGGGQRRWISMLALMLSVAVPAWTALGRDRGVAAVVPDRNAARDGGVPQSTPSLARVSGGLAELIARADTRSLRRLDASLAIAWTSAAVLALATYGAATLLLARRRRTWRRGEIDGEPVLLAPATGPAVIGTLHPEIVVPEWSLSLSSEQRALMIEHERQHVRAHDPLLLHAAAMVALLMPWNIAAWWLNRRLRLAVELDCDARVLARGHNLRAYGTLLLDVCERRTGSGLLLAPALFERTSSLTTRILAMHPQRPRFPRVQFALGATVALAVTILACEVPSPEALAPDGKDVASTRLYGQMNKVLAEKDAPTAGELRETLKRYFPSVARGEGGPSILFLVRTTTGKIVLTETQAAAFARMPAAGEDTFRMRMRERAPKESAERVPLMAGAVTRTPSEPTQGRIAAEGGAVEVRAKRRMPASGMQLPSGVGAIQPDDIASIDITKHAAGAVAPNAVSIISIVLKPGAKVPLVAHNP